MKVKNVSILLFIFSIIFCLNAENTVFDNIKWEESRSKGDITLYVNTSNSINFYKAETRIKYGNVKKLFDKLMQFDSYPEIFPKTLVFKPVKRIDENSCIVYSKLDFTPMKNRDYFINLSTKSKGDEVVVYWYPEEYGEKCNIEDKSCLRIDYVFGRWTFRKEKSGEIYISVEYHNNWKINVGASILTYFEKESTIDAIKNFLKYALKEKGSGKTW